ncbi:hypothetical protein PENFLA_c051G03065 [Penicillium flavigenum]|uniref:Uncharacterized protein n=1 Tax=Penicillium flavigenum TaxID=254877 RepID=A0A1V6SHM3_9EURO|nr:hypothetical protein PENFLA_c051G03065 [Penicillium flavigenum]
MNRPRRAAARKPQGYYSPSSSIGKGKISAGRVQKLRKVKGQTEQVATGSRRHAPPPTSMIIPDPLDTAALERDLKKSYEGKIAPPKLPKRQTRWRQPATNPIVDLAEVPKGWNSLEPDLDADDLVSQISRCRERIGDNIMSQMFQFKLDDLLKEKKRREAMMAAEPVGLSWPVVQRVDTLTKMLEYLRSGNDECDLIGNVTNIMAAYRLGNLRWTPGLVTYWSKGVQLCQPRPFKWDEFDFINAKHDGVTGFMVEGLEGPGPSPQLASTYVAAPGPQFGSFQIGMFICVKPPDQPTGPAFPLEWGFIDDTGASMTTINKSDLSQLMTYNQTATGRIPPSPPLIGAIIMGVANGTTTVHICRRLEVNLRNVGTNTQIEWPMGTAQAVFSVSSGWQEDNLFQRRPPILDDFALVKPAANEQVVARHSNASSTSTNESALTGKVFFLLQMRCGESPAFYYMCLSC